MGGLNGYARGTMATAAPMATAAGLFNGSAAETLTDLDKHRRTQSLERSRRPILPQLGSSTAPLHRRDGVVDQALHEHAAL
jgi:hypothetical protein